MSEQKLALNLAQEGITTKGGIQEANKSLQDTAAFRNAFNLFKILEPQLVESVTEMRRFQVRDIEQAATTLSTAPPETPGEGQQYPAVAFQKRVAGILLRTAVHVYLACLYSINETLADVLFSWDPQTKVSNLAFSVVNSEGDVVCTALVSTTESPSEAADSIRKVLKNDVDLRWDSPAVASLESPIHMPEGNDDDIRNGDSKTTRDENG